MNNINFNNIISQKNNDTNNDKSKKRPLEETQQPNAKPNKKLKFNPFVSHRNLFLINAGECSRDFVIESQKYKIYEREDYTLNPPKYENMSKGEERFRKFQWYVENAFWKPHAFQSQYIKMAYQVI